MNRWAARIMGLIMLLIFMMLFLNLKKQLVMLQRQGNAPAAPAQTTR
jgi:hypothetical protein